MGGIMSRYKVEISNVNTANIKVLKQKEMEELFIKMHNGDMLAKDELINGYKVEYEQNNLIYEVPFEKCYIDTIYSK